MRFCQRSPASPRPPGVGQHDVQCVDRSCTPLMHACRRDLTEQARVMVPLLTRLSSPETLRAVDGRQGLSAADCLLARRDRDDGQPWFRKALFRLIRAGVPVRPDNAERALRHMASLGAELDSLAVEARSRPVPWEAHAAAVRDRKSVV